MSKLTAAQQRLFDNVVLIAATRLLFNRLHQNFPRTKLDEVVTIHNGQSLPANEREETGEYDVYAAGGLTGRHSKRLTDKPFVVIGRKGSAGKPTYAPNGGWVIDTAYYAQPNDESKLDCKFLFYAISSLDFTSDIISTAIPGINRTSIYRHSIPLPPRDIQDACIQFLDVAATKVRGEFPILPSPLSELRQIVARIEELAAKIEEARGLRRKAGEEIEALFESSVGATFNRLNSVERKKLLTLTSKIGSGSTPKGGRASYPSSGIPFIRSLNVRMRKFQWEDIAFIDNTTHETMKGTQVKPNDVLLNITGASIGRVACAPSDLAESNVNQHVAILRPIETLHPRYLMYWLSQPSIQEFINDKQKGATRQGFTKAQIESFEVPLPPPPKQRRIVAYLDALQAKVDALRHLQEETGAELDALLPAVLDKAFKGEL